MTATVSRQTKYAAIVIDALAEQTHATNAELLEVAQRAYPEVSATTIHRVTARLKERGLIGCAPKTMSGAERYDIRTDPHHHFMCQACGAVCDMPDTDELGSILRKLQTLSEECELAGMMTLQGVCKKCTKK